MLAYLWLSSYALPYWLPRARTILKLILAGIRHVPDQSQSRCSYASRPYRAPRNLLSEQCVIRCSMLQFTDARSTSFQVDRVRLISRPRVSVLAGVPLVAPIGYYFEPDNLSTTGFASGSVTRSLGSAYRLMVPSCRNQAHSAHFRGGVSKPHEPAPLHWYIFTNLPENFR